MSFCIISCVFYFVIAAFVRIKLMMMMMIDVSSANFLVTAQTIFATTVLHEIIY